MSAELYRMVWHGPYTSGDARYESLREVMEDFERIAAAQDSGSSLDAVVYKRQSGEDCERIVAIYPPAVALGAEVKPEQSLDKIPTLAQVAKQRELSIRENLRHDLLSEGSARFGADGLPVATLRQLLKELLEQKYWVFRAAGEEYYLIQALTTLSGGDWKRISDSNDPLIGSQLVSP